MLILYIIGISIGVTYSSVEDLESLHVIFRHGNRTPQITYPNDPYINFTYYPFGYSQLTKAGKKTAFNIGVSLRERYDKFLGNVYTPELLEAISSDYARCKMTTQLVLAGLFPPTTDTEIWNTNLAWQPIPYSYISKQQDKILRSVLACPQYVKLKEEYQNSEKYSSLFAKYTPIGNYLKSMSGFNSTIGSTAIKLFSTLYAQNDWGLELPQWTRSVWPGAVTEISNIVWDQSFATERFKTLGAGFLMLKIINDVEAFMRSDISVPKAKIHLYGCHDWNIVAVLSWLNAYKPHNPPYGAYIILEIHNIFGTRCIKILYQDYSQKEMTQINIPECYEHQHCGIGMCPFDEFKKIYAHRFPTDRDCY